MVKFSTLLTAFKLMKYDDLEMSNNLLKNI